MNRPDSPPDRHPVPPGRVLDDDPITVALHESVAVLSLSDGNGNRLDEARIAALTQALGRVLADRAVAAVVLAAQGRDFCTGPTDDLPPPGPDAVALPSALAALSALCRRIEAAPKPVVCALRGRVASAGLALALACAARVADPRAVLSLPEARLGRLGPGNAAVRLAWRAGAEAALSLVSGTAMPATEAAERGLIDRLADNPLAEAIALARDLPTGTPPQALAGLRDAAGFRAAVAAARAALPAPLPAHRLAEGWRIDCVEAAQLLPPDQALAFDLVRAQDAALRPESRARAHLARASRRTLTAPAAPPGVIAAALPPEIAARLLPGLLHGGAQVIALAPDGAALAETLQAVAEAQLAMVRAGTLTQAAAADDWRRMVGRLHLDPDDAPVVALADAAAADWLDAHLPATTPRVLWSPPGTALREHDPAPRALVLAPAPTRPAHLVEVIAAGDASAAGVEAARGLALRLGLTPVCATGGPLLTPMIRAAARAAARLRMAGVAPATLSATGILPPGLASGETGPDAGPLPLSPERLLLLAVINTGAWLLESGRAMRPSDLDLAMVLGAGWPEWRGGPMAEADGLGPIVLRHELRLAAALDAEIWTPEPIFDELIRRGWRFEDLNGD